MRIGREMETIGYPPWGTYILLELESIRGNERNNQPFHCL